MSEWSLTVSELNEYVRLKLAGDAMLRNVTVRGEISGFKRHVSGHLYFTLKDDKARIQCAMFRMQAAQLDFVPADGQQVVVTGAAGLYTVSGSYQLYVETMRREGAGDLFLRFERLKAQLASEGLFDPSMKKPLPMLPKRIGVATSRTGAAFQDIIRVSRARNPRIEIVIAPCAVQGAGAAQEIARSIRELDTRGHCDVILVGRGGGSMEDLWAFNEEIVARAIYACRTPVISCVGHEIDFTIADFVADVRAATPSNAAEIAVTDIRDARITLIQMYKRLRNALNAGQKQRRMRLSASRSMYFIDPAAMLINRRRDVLNAFKKRMDAALERGNDTRRAQLVAVGRALSALDPRSVLARGYACVRTEDGILSDARGLRVGQRICVDMRDASVTANVENVQMHSKPKREETDK